MPGRPSGHDRPGGRATRAAFFSPCLVSAGFREHLGQGLDRTPDTAGTLERSDEYMHKKN